jgi:RND superfamily putative drug exporter
MVLVPAFMHVMGHWNWWAPTWLARLHERFGISEGPQIDEISQTAPAPELQLQLQGR